MRQRPNRCALPSWLPLAQLFMSLVISHNKAHAWRRNRPRSKAWWSGVWTADADVPLGTSRHRQITWRNRYPEVQQSFSGPACRRAFHRRGRETINEKGESLVSCFFLSSPIYPTSPRLCEDLTLPLTLLTSLATANSLDSLVTTSSSLVEAVHDSPSSPLTRSFPPEHTPPTSP